METIEKLAMQDNLRSIRMLRSEGKYLSDGEKRYLNLSSNDYLGLTEPVFQQQFFEQLPSGERFLMSNPASRLMTGNSPEYEMLESSLEAIYPGKRALVLGSGYLTNTAILSSLTEKGDLILADKYVHASIIDGLALCPCDWTRYRHNDLDHLESLLKKHCRPDRVVWVATESLFSMDGDLAPLLNLIDLKRRYGFYLYLDEAHAFGAMGQNGTGCAVDAGVLDEVDVLVGTFGKAMASYGAFAIVSAAARQLLVNRMRSLIFSTALPPLTLLWSDFLVRRLPEFEDRREHLRRLAAQFGPRATHIIPLIMGENAAALRLAEELKKRGYWTMAVRYPTVPLGRARVRVSLSAALDAEDVQNFRKLCDTIG